MRTSRALIYLFSAFIILFSVLVVNIVDDYGPTSYITYGGSQVPIRSSAEFAGEGKTITYEKRLRNLQPGKFYEIKVVKSHQQRQLPFESAEFMVSEPKREAIISFKKPTQLPSSVGEAELPANLFSYGQIVISSPQDISDKISSADLENTAITFSVDKNFLKYQDADESSVKLHLLSGGAWGEVSLSRLPDSSILYYYKAQVPFGIYAITYKAGSIGEEVEEEIIEPVCGNTVVEDGENCATCPADVQCKSGEVCQAGNCVKPPAPVAQPVQQQQLAPPPRVRTPQKGFNWMMWILVPAIVILMVLIIFMMFRRGEKETGFEIEQPVVAQPAQPTTPAQPIIEQRASPSAVADHRVAQIKNYINSVMAKGFRKDQVRTALIAKNWPADLIDKAFSELGK